MSKYTEQMETELRAKPQWTYQDCQAFAAEYPEISPRSVVSKIKDMQKQGHDVEYIKQEPQTKRAEPEITKADIVESLASALGANLEVFSGLSNANRRAIDELVRVVTPLMESDEELESVN